MRLFYQMKICRSKCFYLRENNGNYVGEKHWHGSLEIFAIFEGSLRFFLHEKEYLLKAGEFIIVNSNEVHSVFSPKPNRDSCDTNSYVGFWKVLFEGKFYMFFS